MTLSSSRRYVGERVPRVNDHKALHGTGRYVDDIELPGMLHAAIVRSPVAHGRLRSFDPSGLDDGLRALSPDDLSPRVAGNLPVLWTLGDQTIRHTPVVDTHLRYVGQPVGVVVGPSRYLAEDGVDQVELDIEDLPVVVAIDDALAEGAPLLYPEAGTNLLATFHGGDSAEHTASVFAAAQRVARTTIHMGRVHGLPMEPRGVVAVPEPGGGLCLYTSTQAPHAVRDAVCEVLGLSVQHQIRVVAPDVGGGFGLKDHIYEDEVMVAIAALTLGRPGQMGRGPLRVTPHDPRMPVTRRTTSRWPSISTVGSAGLRIRAGANAVLASPSSAAVRCSPPTVWFPGRTGGKRSSTTGQLVATNTMSTGAYRGFGQTQAALVRERVVDLVARALGRIRSSCGCGT